MHYSLALELILEPRPQKLALESQLMFRVNGRCPCSAGAMLTGCPCAPELDIAVAMPGAPCRKPSSCPAAASRCPAGTALSLPGCWGFWLDLIKMTNILLLLQINMFPVVKTRWKYVNTGYLKGLGASCETPCAAWQQ